MQSPRYFFSAFFLTLTLLVVPARAEETRRDAGPNLHSLWKVTGAHSTVYLLGSIHFLTEADYPLPQPIETAYSNSSVVVFETDMAQMEQADTQLKMMSKAQLPAGETLEGYLSASTYAAFSNHVAKLGLPPAMFNQFRPFMAVSTIAIMDLQKLGVSPDRGLDKHFFDRATKDSKQIVPLETVDFQIGLLTGFSKEEEESLTKASLKDMDNVSKEFKEIVKAWKVGDAASLEKYLNEAMKEAPGPFKRLLTDRNHNWMGKIEELLNGDKNAIVIVGAGHLVGKEGVVELVKKKGFKVTQL